MREYTPDEYAARAQRLTDLVGRPGWRDFCDLVALHAKTAIENNIDTPHKMAVAVGAHNALLKALEIPAMEIAGVAQYLASQNDV